MLHNTWFTTIYSIGNANSFAVCSSSGFSHNSAHRTAMSGGFSAEKLDSSSFCNILVIEYNIDKSRKKNVGTQMPRRSAILKKEAQNIK